MCRVQARHEDKVIQAGHFDSKSTMVFFLPFCLMINSICPLVCLTTITVILIALGERYDVPQRANSCDLRLKQFQEGYIKYKCVLTTSYQYLYLDTFQVTICILFPTDLKYP